MMIGALSLLFLAARAQSGDDDDGAAACSNENQVSLNGFLISPVTSMGAGDIQTVACPNDVIGSAQIVCDATGYVTLAPSDEPYCNEPMNAGEGGVCNKFGKACGFALTGAPPTPSPSMCEDKSSESSCAKVLKKKQCDTKGSKCQMSCDLC